MGKREENVRKRRRRILDAARRLIEASGPEALSMRTLAAEARLAVTTLYHHFPTKDDLLAAMAEDALAKLRPALARSSAKSPFEAVLALATEPVRHVLAQKRVFWPILSAGYRNVATRAHPNNVLLYGNLIAYVAELIGAAQTAGYLLAPIEPRVVAAELFYAFRGALEDWSCAEIDDAALERRLRAAVLLNLLAVATPKARPRLLRELAALQARVDADLTRRFSASLRPRGRRP